MSESVFQPSASQTVTLAVTGTSGARQVCAQAGDCRSVMISSPAANSIAFIKYGDSTVAATVPSGATKGDIPIFPGTVQTLRFTQTYIAAIGTAGTTLYFTPGEGM